MNQTTFQPAEIYDSNGNLIQQGAYGINTPFCTSTGDGVYDYIVNNLNALKDMIAAGYIAVATLPSSGQTNKYYVITEGANAGKCYIWTGTAWQELATQINGKSAYEIAVDHGFIGTEQQWLDSFTADAIAAADRAEAAMETIETGLETLEGIDARFANVEDHAEMTDSNVDATKKRISNVEKLLQGNLYDYQTDETVAYEKTVPAGAMPYAGIEKLGGKTLVWNQLNDNRGTTGNAGGIDFTNNGDGSWTINGTATSSSTKIFGYNDFVNGHKYYIKGCPSGGSASTYNFGVAGSKEDVGNGGMLTATATGRYNLRFNFASGSAFTNVTVYPMLIDLTLMFGAGNEPSTVEEFQQQFPAQYYPYNAGTLLSAGVTEVKSVGINIWDEQWENGGINVTTGIKDGQTDRIRSKNYIPVQSGVSYYFNGLPTTENMVVLCYRYDKTYTGTYYYRNVNQSTETLPQGTAFILFYMVAAYGTTYRNDICIHVSNASINGNYYPYQEHTYPIPAEVQALDGYGWSAGSVYNYIDFERKVFVQNVGRVDLGTQSWSYSSQYGGVFSANFGYPDSTKSMINNPSGITCPRYVFKGVYSSLTDMSCGYIYYKNIAVKDDSFNGDTAAFKTAMSGVYAYYPLATPIETDISAYLTDDNLIEVESGGTLTMYSDANGDDDAYHIPVPSTVEYMIDLNVATGGTENEP